MGKTVKSRLFMSITSVICVAVLCIVANSKIPAYYESHLKKEAAEASQKVSQQIDKPAPAPTQPAAPTQEFIPEESAYSPADEAIATEDSNVYDIEESYVEEEPSKETPSDENAEESEEPEEGEEEAPAESKSFFEKILDFFTSIFEFFTSGSLIDAIKEFINSILSLLGINFQI